MTNHTDNINAKRDAKLFDALLEAAAEESMAEEMAELPSIEELNRLYAPSRLMDKKIRGAILKQRNAERRKKSLRTSGKVAALFTVVIILSVAILMGVEASRIFIVNTFIDTNIDHIIFEFRDDYTDSDTLVLGRIVLEYVPEGFKVTDRQIFATFDITTLSDDKGREITITRTSIVSANMGFSNEKNDHSVTVVNGVDIHAFKALDNEYLNSVMWQQGDDAVTISSVVDIEILLQMVKSIIY